MARSAVTKRAGRAAAPAAYAASNLNMQYCAQPPAPPPVFRETVTGPRLEAIYANGKTWANGTKLHYYLFATGKFAGSAADQNEVRKAFKKWKDQKIGLEFLEVKDPKKAELRIGFAQADGSWSLVGTDNLTNKNSTQRTMNFGWPLTTTYGHDTALHEIGHALGLDHEHQNPNSGIVWNEPAVRSYFAGAPNNWSQSQIEQNILNKIPAGQVTGSKWDPNSVMEYQFQAGMINVPATYKTKPLIPAGGLSALDVAWVAKTYPFLGTATLATLKPFQSEPVVVASPGQKEFLLQPKATKKYNLRLFGDSDATLLLYELNGKEETYLAGQSDAGGPDNAALEERLEEDKRYVVKVKVIYAADPNSLSLMVW